MSPTGLENTPLFNLAFWAMAAAAVASALMVVLLPNLFRAALSLVVTFLSLAGLFVLLNAEFLGVVQVLIYAGAVSILLIFGILLTRDLQRGNLPNRLQVPALFLSAFLLATVVLASVATGWAFLSQASLAPPVVERAGQVLANTAPVLGGLLVREFALPFIAVSVVLLAALIGAVVLVMER